MTRSSLPLVFACAGCSFAGRVTYDLARELTRQQKAVMSCLAGVGIPKNDPGRIDVNITEVANEV